MNLLLDTHAVLWWAVSSPRLGRNARSLIRSADNTVWVSAVSLWEISIKAALRRASVFESFSHVAPADLERHGFRELPITFRHALEVRELPMHHADPFDHMLVAQARSEGLTILTGDARIHNYDVRTVSALA